MGGKVLETESDQEKLQSIDTTKKHSFRSMKMSSSFTEEELDSKEFNLILPKFYQNLIKI